MEIGVIVAGLLIILFLFEYRVRRPDHITLYESRGQVRQRKTRFYPRHFSLCIPATIHTVVEEIEAEVKGRLMVKIRVAISVAASTGHLPTLIRVGGWNENAVSAAAKELEMKIDTLTRGFTEKVTIEAISSEKLSSYLQQGLSDINQTIGVDIISINIQSIEPVDKKIAEAIRQQESARIFEQTEIANQNARITVAKTKAEADEKIAIYEHELNLKKYELKEIIEEKEAILARNRVEEEIILKKKQLEIDQKEIETLSQHPEILMLTPQVARLAEASQSLRNARTVVSLSGKDTDDGNQVFAMLKTILQNIMTSMDKSIKAK